MIVHHLLALASHEDFQDCEVDHNPENSMYWLRGRGFHKWSMPDDLPILFQSHDTPMYQVVPDFTVLNYFGTLCIHHDNLYFMIV